MWTSARSPGPTHVAAAMLTPASLIAAATCASAPGVFSMSMTRSTAMFPVAVSVPWPARCEGTAVRSDEFFSHSETFSSSSPLNDR
jgi:hypothetical protein